LQVRCATDDDVDEIRKLLDLSKLPSKDLDQHIDNFILISDQTGVIGVGGLELYADTALLRSVAVTHAYRNQGLGKKIFQLLESNALAAGISCLYLLTESSEIYFKQLGFSVISREKAPHSIKNTEQFKGLCPSSAIVMRYRLAAK